MAGPGGLEGSCSAGCSQSSQTVFFAPHIIMFLLCSLTLCENNTSSLIKLSIEVNISISLPTPHLQNFELYFCPVLFPKCPIGSTKQYLCSKCTSLLVLNLSTNLFTAWSKVLQVLNILNTVYTVRFFSSKCSLFHNSNLFIYCIIHILYTGCAKI